MKRLFQFGTLMLLATVVMPLHEVFGTSEEGSLANDKAFMLFAFVFAICLVLLVCTLIAAGILKVWFVSLRAMLRAETAEHTGNGFAFIFVVPPLPQLVPLRI
jgi:hypothetical protein